MSNGRGGSRRTGELSEYVGLPQYGQLTDLLQSTQQQANLGRIPGAAGLEAQSSLDIASLLNPPSLFPDTSRIAAETAAGRGVSGSGAGYSTAVRMTDEERLRRMALGQNMLSQAYGRNPAAPLIDPLRLGITPFQREELALRRGGGLMPGRTYPGGGMPHLGLTPYGSPETTTDWWSGGGGGGGGVRSLGDIAAPLPDIEDMNWDLFNTGSPWQDPSSWMDQNTISEGAYPGLDYSPYQMPQYGLPPVDQEELIA